MDDIDPQIKDVEPDFILNKPGRTQSGNIRRRQNVCTSKVDVEDASNFAFIETTSATNAT